MAAMHRDLMAVVKPGLVDDYGSGPGGGIAPPSGSPPAPIDFFDGRTTGFGDMHFVGLFSPKKPVNLDNGGKRLWYGRPFLIQDIR